MARGPFEGTWRQGVRPTVVSAPDALVFINGETEIIGCGKCRRRFDLNKYITSIQVDLNIDSPPGSASINLSVPRHSVDEFYFDGNPLITPMMEVEIFAKGFFLVEGVPQYYPIFWGLVTEVSDSYSAGEHSFSINCADILKWWELCKMNINPAFTQTSGQLGRSIFGNVFFGTNPYDVIWTLAQQSFGDIVVGSGSLVSLYKEGQQKTTFNHALSDIMAYWNSRFSRIRSNLLLYGTQGNAVRGDLLNSQYQSQGGATKFKNAKVSHFASRAVRAANGGDAGSQMVFDPTDANVVAFRTQFMQAGQVNFWSSEYQTKLELANAAKEAIGFEFYMDVTGDIVFKPPFYNLDILSNKPVSWIQDIDIIDWDLSESEAEVVTQVQLQGAFGGNIDYGMPEEATPFTSVTDYHLLRKYGWRTQTFNSEFMGDPLTMFYMGLDLLDRYNARRFRGTINIPMRPELRLGFPVYVAPKDQIWYVGGISHNIQFGGRAQTTLSLTAKRSKFIAPKGIGTIELVGFANAQTGGTESNLSQPPANPTAKQLRDSGRFKAKVGEAAQLPPTNFPTSSELDNPYTPLILRHPKTGRIVGYPDVVMAYTRPFQPPPDQLAKASGRKNFKAERAVKAIRESIDEAAPKVLENYEERARTATNEDRLREKHMNNRYTYGLNSAGVYVYLHDTTSVLKEMIILPSKNVVFDDDTTNQAKFEGSSGMIRPVSDERGFEVIGHYKYGRNVSLRDGSLVLAQTSENPNAQNQAAEIRQPLALSGALFETLQAQSSGITVKSTISPNPADAITRLAPEDLQTAAVMTPEGPEFKHPGDNFINVAPLGTPEQQGSTNQTSVADVEASQLSRALTLTEMSVRQEFLKTEECECLLGRADLTFINVGYQVRVLRTAATDNSTIQFGAQSDAGNLELAQQIQTQVNEELQAELDRLDEIGAVSGGGAGDPAIEAAKQQAIADAQAQLNQQFQENGIPESDFQAISEALDPENPKPIADTVLLSRSETISRVEQFLTGLYTALDGAHQEVEQALRGEFISDPGVTPSDVRFGAGTDLGGVSPPFSPAGRALGGDPEALAKQGSSALNQMVSTWNSFGDKLKANAKRTKLQGEIERLKKKIAELTEECEALEEQKETGGSLSVPFLGDPSATTTTAVIAAATGTPFIPSLDDRLEACQENLDDSKQKLANAQQKLNELNQKFPP